MFGIQILVTFLLVFTSQANAASPSALSHPHFVKEKVYEFKNITSDGESDLNDAYVKLNWTREKALIGHYPKNLAVLDLKNGSVQEISGEDLGLPLDQVESVSWGPGDLIYVNATDFRRSRVYNFKTGKIQFFLSWPGYYNGEWTGDGRYFIKQTDKGVTFVDLKGHPVKSIDLGEEGEDDGIFVSPSGNLMTHSYRTEDGFEMSIVDTHTWETVSKFRIADTAWNSAMLAFSPDDRFIAGPKPELTSKGCSGGGTRAQGPLGIWGASTGKLEAKLDEFCHPIESRVEFSHDSRYLASSLTLTGDETEGTIRIYDIHTRQSVLVGKGMNGGDGYSRWLKWSPGDKLLATGSYIYDVRDMKAIRRVPVDDWKDTWFNLLEFVNDTEFVTGYIKNKKGDPAKLILWKME